MNWIIYMIFSVLLLGVGFLLSVKQKNKVLKWHRILISWIVLNILFLGICIPLSTYSSTSFPTAGEAFYSQHRGEICGMVQGEKSCFVIFAKDAEVFDCAILEYTDDNNFKLIPNWSLKEVAQGFIANGAIRIFRYADTEDFYVWGYSRTENIETFTINDEFESDFAMKKILKSSTDTFDTVAFWAKILPVSGVYEMSIDGKTEIIEIP